MTKVKCEAYYCKFNTFSSKNKKYECKRKVLHIGNVEENCLDCKVEKGKA